MLSKMLNDESQTNVQAFETAVNTYVTYANLAPLATADYVLPLIQQAKFVVGAKVDFKSPNAESQMNAKIETLNRLIVQLQVAARKDLWGTPEVEAKAEGAK